MATDAVVSRTKRPTEEFRVSWDFANDLEAGDSVTGQVVTAADSDGVDVTASFLQSPGILGTKIVVQVQGGVSGKDYIVTLKATTSQGDVFIRTILVKVRID